jgi:gas vesicle protein
VAKHEKARKSRGRFLFGLLVGIVIGAAAAILFAPTLGASNPDVESDDLLKRGQARYGQIANLMRERYGDAFALGQDAYSRAKDEILTRYTRAKAGE